MDTQIAISVSLHCPFDHAAQLVIMIGREIVGEIDLVKFFEGELECQPSLNDPGQLREALEQVLEKLPRE